MVTDGSGPAGSGPPYGVGLRGNSWDVLDGRVAAELPTVSVIVVHYEQQAELDRTLAGLARQTYPSELLEVIVVDDGSAAAPRMSHGARLVRQEDRGFRLSAARNLGAASSTGRILCFLDADTAPEPGYVHALTRLPALAPEAVTVGRRRHALFERFSDDDPIEVAAPLAALDEPQWLADAYAASRDLLDSDDRSYRFVIGAVIACSRWFFDSVGGFDESFTQYGGEDWEWAHRAWLGGAVFAHVPSAVAWHNGPDWGGRSEGDASDGNARQRRKNAETLQLAQSIPAAGSAPRAVLGAQADVLIRVVSAISDAAAFVCVDSLLTVVPRARVEVVGPLPEVLRGDPRVVSAGSGAGPVVAATGVERVRIDIPNAVAVRLPDAPRDNRLAWAVEAVGVGELGEVLFTGENDEPLMTVTSRRAALRRARWRDDALFDTLVERAPWLAPITTEPSVAAYLGGWG
ncbi:glycosyltransferase [Agreia sp. PsM10]|uniref:glycosyltransferase family 2 protein n=1 Tax=Agreia sp. PsM10 TaxID=3030533 RepID=UPI00263BE21A|nr:glycosyltransferase [Agreia sp. PsM10]MDN4640697.1 glycosyltransferase [Agreia sp. PsM10]